MKSIFLALVAAAPLLAANTTVTGPYLGPSSTVVWNGYFTCTPNSAPWIDASGNAIAPLSVTVQVTAGAFTVDFTPTDTTVPANVWYNCMFYPKSATPYGPIRYQVPTSATPIKISQLVALTSPPVLTLPTSGDVSGNLPGPLTVLRVSGSGANVTPTPNTIPLSDNTGHISWNWLDPATPVFTSLTIGSTGIPGCVNLDGTDGITSSSLCVFPSGSGLSVNNPLSLSTNYLTENWTAGPGGVAPRTLVSLNTSGRVVTTAASGTDAIGVAVGTASSGQALEVAIRGRVGCTADNATTAGDLVIPGIATAGTCRDAGTANIASVAFGRQVIGRMLTSVSAGQTASIELWAPGSAGSSILPDVLQQTWTASTADGLAYTVTIPGLSGIPDGMALLIRPSASNAGGAGMTITFNGGTTLPLKSHGGNPITIGGTILISRPYWIVYDGTNNYWRLLPYSLGVPATNGCVAYTGSAGGATSTVTFSAGTGLTATNGDCSANVSYAITYPVTTALTAVTGTATSGGAALTLQVLPVPSGWPAAGRSVRITGGGNYTAGAGTGTAPTITVLVCDNPSCVGTVSAAVLSCGFQAVASGATNQPWDMDLTVGVAAGGVSGVLRSVGNCKAVINGTYVFRTNGAQSASADLSGANYYLVTKWTTAAGGVDQTPNQWLMRAEWGQ